MFEIIANMYGRSVGALLAACAHTGSSSIAHNGKHRGDSEDPEGLARTLEDAAEYERLQKADTPERSKRYGKCRMSAVDYYGREVFCANVPREDIEDIFAGALEHEKSAAHVIREALRIVGKGPAIPQSDRHFEIPSEFIAFLEKIALRNAIPADLLLSKILEERFAVPEMDIDEEYFDDTAELIRTEMAGDGPEIDCPAAGSDSAHQVLSLSQAARQVLTLSQAARQVLTLSQGSASLGEWSLTERQAKRFASYASANGGVSNLLNLALDMITETDGPGVDEPAEAEIPEIPSFEEIVPKPRLITLDKNSELEVLATCHAYKALKPEALITSLVIQALESWADNRPDTSIENHDTIRALCFQIGMMSEKPPRDLRDRAAAKTTKCPTKTKQL